MKLFIELKKIGRGAALGLALIAICVAGTSGQTPSGAEKLAQAERLFGQARKLSEQTDSAAAQRGALEKFEQARRLYAEADSRREVVLCLGFMSGIHSKLGENRKALELSLAAVPIYETIDFKAAEATNLIGIGKIYAQLGERAKTLEYYNRALPIFRQIRDRMGEALTLNNLGWTYTELGDDRNALKFYDQALPIYKSFNDGSEGVTLSNIGIVYKNSEDWLKALEFYNAALAAHQMRGDKFGEALVRGNMAAVYSRIGARQKALDNHLRVLEIARAAGAREFEATALQNIGRIYASFEQPEKALEFYDQALLINKATGNSDGEASALLDFMRTWNELGNRRNAVIYGKQAVNIYQRLRQNIRDLENDLQNSFLQSIESAYRELADILIAEGRFAEAQIVLDLLKKEEYGQLARRSGSQAADNLPYSQAEAAVVTEIENLAQLEREKSDLQRILRETGELAPEQNSRLEKINRQIAVANQAFDETLARLGKTGQTAARVDEIKDGQVLQSALAELAEKTGSGVVALYTVLNRETAGGEDGAASRKSSFGWVILVTENRRTAYPIDVAGLENAVFNFRAALSSPTHDPQPLAEKIYAAIFRQPSNLKKTLEQDLQEHFKSQENKTLMWSLDGVLRYIPTAALHDGKGYLVESYRHVVFTNESFVWLMNEYRNDWRVLGLGVSDARTNFSALPGVKTELETIVREPNRQSGILNGSVRLNENFKKQTFFNVVGAGAFPVVHISSHYNFDPVAPENSFLLAGDGNLTFTEIKTQQNLFKKVDLLTLSACDTGVSGNGKEAEGFAYLAQSLGAKSVIASLWKVSDAGTPELMIRFYKLRAENPQMSKGEAFRKAQLSLLGAETKNANASGARRSDVVDLSGAKIELPLFEKDAKHPFAHPHYWSSFVLIGNWR